jgi:hypothetical protein
VASPNFLDSIWRLQRCMEWLSLSKQWYWWRYLPRVCIRRPLHGLSLCDLLLEENIHISSASAHEGEDAKKTDRIGL